MRHWPFDAKAWYARYVLFIHAKMKIALVPIFTVASIQFYTVTNFSPLHRDADVMKFKNGLNNITVYHNITTLVVSANDTTDICVSTFKYTP